MHNAKFKRKTKRFVSSMVAVAMATTMLPTIPAFAATGTTTYSYDGYTVDYTVVNEWGSGQSIEVKITNTGEESILNWAFKYDTEGTINGIWNATILENQGDDYLIKNNGWNYEIAPNQSVTFGYTLSDDFSTPDLFELYSNRVDITDGYTASINVTEAWANGINGEIVITNTSSDNALEAWMLTFDSNFIINNLWDGRLIESRDNHYVISSEMWTNPIPVGSSIVIGFSASIETEVTPEIKNYFLSEVEIEGLEIDWEDPTDTDDDGLPDVYEKNVYNTDLKNPDSDGDNLPDGYEVITSRTNPALSDSDDNSITDDSEDLDTDGLSNYEEFVLGTNPHLNDTDEDYLTDGEEVNSYGTDPLNPDTDEDTILDSDEVLLGLDPTNPDDGDTTVKQSISEDELRVNRYNEDFKISIELEASNNVKRFIKQGVSKYAGILSDNNAIIGTPINIEYNAGTIIGGTEVSYTKWYKNWGQPIYVEKQEDGTYLLERDTEYTISIIGGGNSEFNFTVEQDNWVYAPDGGIWEVTEYSNSSAITSTLCYERIYMPSHRIVSSILELTEDTVCVQINPMGDVEAQLNTILRNTGMQVTQSELDGAITTIVGASASTTLKIYAILVPEPTTKSAAQFIVGLIGEACTYKGVPSAIQTLSDYMEQYGFKRAFTEGNANVKAGKYVSIGLGNVWDPWNDSPYINKISNMGDIGVVNKTISDQEIIDWCGWELED